MLFVSGEAFWLAALFFYLFDSLQPVSPNSVIIVREWQSYRSRLLRYPPGAFGRRFYIPSPLSPFSIVLTGSLSGRQSAKPLPSDQLFILMKNLDGLWQHRIISGCAFLVQFLLLPVLAWLSTLGTALIIALPVIYGLNIAQSITIWRRRKLLGWNEWKVVQFCGNFLLCPPYSANVARTLAMHYQMSIDILPTALGLTRHTTIRNVIEPIIADLQSSEISQDPLLADYRKAVNNHEI